VLCRRDDGSCGRDWEELCKWHADFVVIDLRRGLPWLVIELQDHWHSRVDRRARDMVERLVLQEAGVALVAVKGRSSYDLDFCRRLFADRLPVFMSA